ncbi:MAG TPA: cation:proton antiporter [Vicinamibacterales bacterium]|nr:cation:proton antiporter [Vicinamibacterales bacterium]
MTLIISILLLLAVARVAAEIAERRGQPALIGEVMAGLILGPSILNLVHVSPELQAMSDLGVLLLMLLAGMEIELDRLSRAFLGRNLWISAVSFLFPLAIGLLAGIVVGLDGWRAVFLGLCIAITALPVSVRILMDLGRLQSDTGQRIISAAIANDILALLLLGLILNVNRGTGDLQASLIAVALTGLKVLLFMGLVLASARLLNSIARRLQGGREFADLLAGRLRVQESSFALILLFVIGFAALADVLGLHFVVGAFFGSLLLSRELLGRQSFDQVQKTTTSITMGLLAPLFFATVGLEFDVFALTDALLVTAVLVAAFAGKILAGRIGGWLSGLSPAEGWALGVGLNGRGIMELVVAKIALANGLIDIQLFSVLVLMGLVTTLVTPGLLKYSFRKLDELAVAGTGPSR